MSDKTLKISLLFCKPQREYYYEYSINTMEKTYMIDKDELKGLIRQNFSYKIYIEAVELIDRFYMFLIDNETDSIDLFEEDDEITPNYINMENKSEKPLTFLEKCVKFKNNFTNKGLKK